jgi:tetratricopeptide (TPR) repeat protein
MMNPMRISQLMLCGMLAVALAGCGSDSPSATKKVVKLDTAPEHDTGRARELNQQAATMIADRDFDGAENLLKQAIQIDPEFGPAQNNLGVVYFNQSKLYPAAQQFLLAASLMPRDPEPRNGLGLVFESAHRLDDAINYYDRARLLDPANLEYLGNSARARVRRGDQTQELRGMLQTIAAGDPRNDWNQWARDTLRHMDRPSSTEPAGN